MVSAQRVLVSFLLAGAGFGQSPNWTHNPATGHDYALILPMSWTAARSFAGQHGAHLVAIESQAENDWVAAQFLAPSLGFPIYLGMTDAAVEGQWRTVLGLSAPYANWWPGQPDNHLGNQHVAIMGDANPTFGILRGQWDDVDGLGLTFAVMERPRPQYVAFGSGCAGSNGMPWLASSPGGALPRPGMTISLSLGNLPLTAGLAFGIVSFSNTQWGWVVLPLDLGSYGMPGCRAHVALPPPGWVTGIVHQNGAATWQEAVPNLTVLVGIRFFLQAWIPDAGATNALGATVSNALETQIGL